MARKVTVIPANPTGGSNAASGGGRKTRVAAYCRVSTDHEEQEGSFKNQVDYYTKLIAGKPDWELAGIFADDGISGTGTKKRDGFMGMIAACDEGRVDLVITKSISRFARNTQDSLNYSRKLKNRGIPIIFEKESINTMEASGELMFTILSSLAQEESRNISENTAWGIRS
ncbi:MAG: recombinase family protein, partial [Clostridia bacterium]|nr:recombinase family protein [Clostridia bacterium]